MSNIGLKLKQSIILKFIVLVLIVLNAGAGFAYGSGFTEIYKVLRVVDGDTIDVDFHGRKERVRLLCVNTPESVHPDQSKNTPLGTTASLYTKKCLTGKSVGLEFEGKRRGRYNRLLAYVIVDDHNFNLELVGKGLSPYYTKYGKSNAYDREFSQAEQTAKERRLNIWDEKTTRQKAGEKLSDFITADIGAATLHGNVKSRVFHTPLCRYFNCKRCTVVFHTKEAALEAGFKPCRICKP